MDRPVQSIVVSQALGKEGLDCVFQPGTRWYYGDALVEVTECGARHARNWTMRDASGPTKGQPTWFIDARMIHGRYRPMGHIGGYPPHTLRRPAVLAERWDLTLKSGQHIRAASVENADENAVVISGQRVLWSEIDSLTRIGFEQGDNTELAKRVTALSDKLVEARCRVELAEATLATIREALG